MGSDETHGWYQPGAIGCYHEANGTQDATGLTFVPCHGEQCPYFNHAIPCVHAQLMVPDEVRTWWMQEAFDCRNPDFGGPPPDWYIGPCMGPDCHRFDELVACGHAASGRTNLFQQRDKIQEHT
ncbi:MAG: hypothetical protein HQM01_08100 [Magnetococcales bacterium]|nr:hypothetical protein [Magnetococcales bacterium]